MQYQSAIFLTLIISLLHSVTSITSTESPQTVDQTFLLLEQQQNKEKQWKQKLQPWVFEQFKMDLQIEDSTILQSFVISLPAYQTYQFRWQISSKAKELQFKIDVYTQEQGNDFAYIRQPAEDKFIQIEAKNDFIMNYEKWDKVYIKKKITLPTSREKFIRVINLHSIPVMLEVSLLGKQFEFDHDKVIKNDDFKLPTQKLEAIMDQVKSGEASRTRVYKWEWGFMEREQHYQSEMLKLTAVELIIILGTAIVQIYCIKNLFDNQQII